MAPSFDHLPDASEDDYDYDENIDYSDLREKFEVQLEEGLDTFVVVDGLPKVDKASAPKLIKFLLRKLTTVGPVKKDPSAEFDGVHMPFGEDGQSLQ